MALPFYRGLRRAYSRSHITLLAAQSVAGLDYPGLFDAIRVMKEADRRFPRGVLGFGRELLHDRFDLGISLPASISSALLLFAARIPNRVGFAEGGADLFLTDALRWVGRESRRHKSDLYLELLGHLTLNFSVPPEAEPLSKPREKLLIVAPGASLPLREWPYFNALLPALRVRYPDHRLIVAGGPGDGKWNSFLSRLGDPSIENLIGKTTLSELRGICETAQAVIANDSGIAHVAATLSGAPTLVLFGPGDPGYVRPRGRCITVSRVPGLPCSPCEKPYCRAPFGYQECLRALSLETVLRELQAILEL